VSEDTIPVLWLCGPPGVGKSTVGWAIYSQLVQSGLQTAYVDIDQLGICYPAPAADPGRYRMKARNLGGVVANFRAEGAGVSSCPALSIPAHACPSMRSRTVW
jgi:adenylylsulfate kinase-like enzyme